MLPWSKPERGLPFEHSLVMAMMNEFHRLSLFVAQAAEELEGPAAIRRLLELILEAREALAFEATVLSYVCCGVVLATRSLDCTQLTFALVWRQILSLSWTSMRLQTRYGARLLSQALSCSLNFLGRLLPMQA